MILLKGELGMGVHVVADIDHGIVGGVEQLGKVVDEGRVITAWYLGHLGRHEHGSARMYLQ